MGFYSIFLPYYFVQHTYIFFSPENEALVGIYLYLCWLLCCGDVDAVFSSEIVTFFMLFVCILCRWPICGFYISLNWFWIGYVTKKQVKQKSGKKRKRYLNKRKKKEFQMLFHLDFKFCFSPISLIHFSALSVRMILFKTIYFQ